MSRKLRWQIPFKSLSEKDCRIDIYEEGYTGSVSVLSVDVEGAAGCAAAVPFEYEEDDDEDLTQFVRTKTGYINVVEYEYGALSDMKPKHITHHYVEFFYDGVLDFIGYMKCEAFSRDLEDGSHELQFPIASPLYYLDSFTFKQPETADEFYNMGMTTIGALMKKISTGLGANYERIFYPQSNVYNASEDYPWDALIPETVMCPLNDDINPYDDDAASIKHYTAPCTYMELIEGLCACRGWIVHEVARTLVFSQYGYDGNYRHIDDFTGKSNPIYATNGSLIGGSYVSGIGSNRDNPPTETVVHPYNKLIEQIDGGFNETFELEVNRVRTNGSLITLYTSDDHGFMGVPLTQVTPDVSADIIGTPSYYNSVTPKLENLGDLNNEEGLFPVAVGFSEPGDHTMSIKKFWVYKYKKSSDRRTIMRARFYGNLPPASRPANSPYRYDLSIQIERGNHIRELKSNGWSNDINLLLAIQIGEKYLRLANDYFYEDITWNAITISRNDGNVVGNSGNPNCISFNYTPSIQDYYSSGQFTPHITIYLAAASSNTNLNDGEYLKINMRVSPAERPAKDFYQDLSFKDEYVFTNDYGGDGECKIDIKLCDWWQSIGKKSFKDRSGASHSAPSYTYLFNPQRLIRQRISSTTRIVAQMYFYSISNGFGDTGLRLIASHFNPVDDEYDVLLSKS